jgi:hypothetical protein
MQRLYIQYLVTLALFVFVFHFLFFIKQASANKRKHLYKFYEVVMYHFWQIKLKLRPNGQPVQGDQRARSGRTVPFGPR